VRDLAEWMVHLLEHGRAGVFNATGPAGGRGCDWNGFLEACTDEARARGICPVRFVRVAESFLVQQGLQPWSELPLWLPSGDASLAGFMRVSLQRAEAQGLRTRPLRDTLAAVMDEALPGLDDKRRKGKLDREGESRLIAAWFAANPPPAA
jgi:2'-hydroxyisoflavone reductase